jgi:hypothetical protein
MPVSGLVSVTIPAFNAGTYIGDALESAARQTYRNIEILVVDDGSHDDTVSVVETFAAKDGRVKLIRQSNAGVAAARNCAIEAAEGEYIAPLDADDIWDSTKLERQVRRIEEGNGTCGMVYCWWVWIDEERNLLDPSPKWHVEGDVLQQLIEINFSGNASVPLFRRECFTQVGGYDPSLRARGAQGCEDWDLALRVAERYSVAAVPAFLVGYRSRLDSMSASCRAMWKSHSIVMQALQKRRPEIPRDAFRQSGSQFAYYLAGISFRTGRYFQAFRWGISARQPRLFVSVMPSVVAMLARCFLARIRPGPAAKLHGYRFDQVAIPRCMIPYDRIYERRWARNQRR